MSFIAGLRNLSNITPAIDSFRPASLNPAITESFIRPPETRQATRVTEPITFTNILEEEEPFVNVTGDLATPEDFVRVTPSRGSANRDFADTDVDRKETSFFGTPTERATAEALSNKFDAQETTTKSLFGPVSFGQETQNQTSYGPPTESFTARITPTDVKRLEDDPNTSAFELAAAKTELAASDLAGRIQTGFEDITPTTVLSGLAQQVAKETTAGFILGAAPTLNPLVATGIAGVAFSAAKTGFQIASSDFEGFGVGDFLSATVNNFLPFGLGDAFGIGTSVEKMESQQVAFDSAVEDAFSFGQDISDDDFDRGLFINDPSHMRTFKDGEEVRTNIRDEIKRAREEVEANAAYYEREQIRQLQINEKIKQRQRDKAAADAEQARVNEIKGLIEKGNRLTNPRQFVNVSTNVDEDGKVINVAVPISIAREMQRKGLLIGPPNKKIQGNSILRFTDASSEAIGSELDAGGGGFRTSRGGFSVGSRRGFGPTGAPDTGRSPSVF